MHSCRRLHCDPPCLPRGDDGQPTPEIATLLRQKPAAAEGRMAKSTPALDALRNRMEALRRDHNALRERMAALNFEIAKS